MRYLLLLLLTGCALQMPKVSVVEKPIPVPCIKQGIDKPIFTQPGKDTEIDDDVNSMRIERKERIIYESQLEAIIKKCTFDPDGKNGTTDSIQ